MNRRLLASLASLAASSTMALAGPPEGAVKPDTAGSKVSTPSASDCPPGKTKAAGESAREVAPGQVKPDDQSAKDLAPGQIKDDASAAQGKAKGKNH